MSTRVRENQAKRFVFMVTCNESRFHRFTPRTIHDLLLICACINSSPPVVVRDCAMCMICIVQIQPRKHVLVMQIVRVSQHDLDHARSGKYLS